MITMIIIIQYVLHSTQQYCTDERKCNAEIEEEEGGRRRELK